jgi:hypothetical protein
MPYSSLCHRSRRSRIRIPNITIRDRLRSPLRPSAPEARTRRRKPVVVVLRSAPADGGADLADRRRRRRDHRARAAIQRPRSRSTSVLTVRRLLYPARRKRVWGDAPLAHRFSSTVNPNGGDKVKRAVLGSLTLKWLLRRRRCATRKRSVKLMSVLGSRRDEPCPPHGGGPSVCVVETTWHRWRHRRAARHRHARCGINQGQIPALKGARTLDPSLRAGEAQ